MDKTILISLSTEDLQTLIVNSVNSCLKFAHLNEHKNSANSEQFLNIEQASLFLSLSKATLYAKVSRGVIPFSKPQGTKRLYFSENELREYLKTGRKKTNQEIEEEAEEYLKKDRRPTSC